MQGMFVTIGDRAEKPQIRIAEQALAVAEGAALEASPNELGGIMIGWWEGGSTAVVQELLPVPDRRAGRAQYERRHSSAQHVLDEYLRTHNDFRCGYIGEWHSHPAPQPPSSIDRGTLSGIVRQVRRPVALIVLSLTPEGGVAAHGLIGRPRWPRRAAIESAPVERMSS